MSRPTVLLVNPPIFDFTAYDFWLRPYGMLRAAGRIRQAVDLEPFDFLISETRDCWDRGRFPKESAAKPEQFRDIPRRFYRFGRPRSAFQAVLRGQRFDFVFVQTVMTYWYLGVREVIEDVRTIQPTAHIILGGPYATLLPEHAESLGPDLAVQGDNLDVLWNMMAVRPRGNLPFWNGSIRHTGIIKLTTGCPFRCTYCSGHLISPEFAPRPADECFEELRQLLVLGATQIAFYDDALLFQPEKVLTPFLERVCSERLAVSFHTPNALNARLVTPELSRLMVRAGFRSFFLGLESSSRDWQNSTGAKVHPKEFSQAVRNLQEAGAEWIATYIITGHPDTEHQELEDSIRFAHQCGTRIMLSDFSPVPGTVDSERCRPWAELREPLSHNKTAFTIRRLGADYANQLKSLVRTLNAELFRG